MASGVARVTPIGGMWQSDTLSPSGMLRRSSCGPTHRHATVESSTLYVVVLALSPSSGGGAMWIGRRLSGSGGLEELSRHLFADGLRPLARTLEDRGAERICCQTPSAADLPRGR